VHVLSTVINFALLVLTVVVRFARQTVTGSRKAPKLHRTP
jgi:hypothetical protein